jgi:hypothetical protein
MLSRYNNYAMGCTPEIPWLGSRQGKDIYLLSKISRPAPVKWVSGVSFNGVKRLRIDAQQYLHPVPQILSHMNPINTGSLLTPGLEKKIRRESIRLCYEGQLENMFAVHVFWVL